MNVAEKTRSLAEPLIDQPPQPRKFTVEEYLTLIDSGFFHPDEKVELIEGELINKMGIGQKHATCVTKLTKIFVKMILDEELEVSVQNPIRLARSRPEPDLVIHTSASLEQGVDPVPEGIILVVEVSQSTLKQDREVKLPIYAQAGISVYWIVNLETDNVEVYTKPAEGLYQEKKVYNPGESILISTLEQEVVVSDFLG
ncbi:MAG: Uma2 family endonuclease [Bacteroidota bacterium]